MKFLLDTHLLLWAAGEPDRLPNLDSAMAVRDAVTRLIADVYAGKLHPKIAAGLAPLMHLQLRVLERTELEKRLTRVEHLLRDGILEKGKIIAADRR